MSQKVNNSLLVHRPPAPAEIMESSSQKDSATAKTSKELLDLGWNTSALNGVISSEVSTACKEKKVRIPGRGCAPYFSATIPLGDYVNTREKVAALRVKNSS
jgi:hypothetical protein